MKSYHPEQKVTLSYVERLSFCVVAVASKYM